MLIPWDHTYLPLGRDMGPGIFTTRRDLGPGTPTPLPCGQNHACENITFPQLHWRAVSSNYCNKSKVMNRKCSTWKECTYNWLQLFLQSISAGLHPHGSEILIIFWYCKCLTGIQEFWKLSSIRLWEIKLENTNKYPVHLPVSKSTAKLLFILKTSQCSSILIDKLVILSFVTYAGSLQCILQNWKVARISTKIKM